MAKYSRVNSGGVTLDAYTASSVAQVKKLYHLLGGTGLVYIAQGSYNKGGVAASAGTHDGGGCVDFSITIKNARNWEILQRAARWAMFAAWHRVPSQGPWPDHVHSVQIGNTAVAWLAGSQVKDYYAHKNGLAGHAADNSWRPSHLFPALYKFPTISVSKILPLAKKKGGNIVPRPSVKRIQQALNLKLGAALKTDGRFGPQTKSAYKRWEKEVGAAAPDGIPGERGLTFLGAGRFNVTK